MATSAPKALRPTKADLAAENERLLAALAASERARDEALEQQTATAEVLRVIASSPADPQQVLDTIAAAAYRLCGPYASGCRFFRLEGSVLHDTARFTAGASPEQLRAAQVRPRPLERGWAAAHAVWERRQIHIADATTADAEYPVSAADARSVPPGATGHRTLLITPLLRHGEPIGVFSTGRTRVQPFSDADRRLMQTFADQAVIAIENARLFSELNEANVTLKKALEQQTATADVLRVIASSPTDLPTVLDEIGRHAVRLCDADSGSVWRYVGHAADLEASGEPLTLWGPRQKTTVTWRMDRATPYNRASLERRPIQVPDVAAVSPEDGYDPEWIRRVLNTNQRSFLVVPLLRQDEPLGTMILVRYEPRPFTEQQIALLQSFADQAVVAIENTRLFTELRDRDERRRQELERASAIQQRLLPSLVEGWPGVLEIAHRFCPAVETSGDFYDVLRLTPSAEGALPPLQIAVGDVAGKGMSAALVTALARSALRSSVGVPIGMAAPSGTLRTAGQRLHQDVGAQHFVACALAVVEPPNLLHRGPRLTLSNAAQVPVLLVRDGGAREIEAPGDRLPLGARPDGDYKDAEVDLRPGDVVVFSSDGVVEAPARALTVLAPHNGSTLPAPAKAGELFGFERLAQSAAHWSAEAQSAEAVAAGIWSDLTAWCGEQSHHDDVTLLVLRVPHPG